MIFRLNKTDRKMKTCFCLLLLASVVQSRPLLGCYGRVPDGNPAGISARSRPAQPDGSDDLLRLGNRRLLATGLRKMLPVHAHASFDRKGFYVQFHTGRTHETVAVIDLRKLSDFVWK
jgi:hypothetical protein